VHVVGSGAAVAVVNITSLSPVGPVKPWFEAILNRMKDAVVEKEKVCADSEAKFAPIAKLVGAPEITEKLTPSVEPETVTACTPAVLLALKFQTAMPSKL
jgi:hypothetical protein